MKSKIRKTVLEKRAGLTEEERLEASVRMAERLLSHEWFREAEYILLFVGYRSEISTCKLIQNCLDIGKRVFLPKVQGAEIEFYEIHSLKDISEGYKGIPEPKDDRPCFRFREEVAQKTLMIMPGVAFDHQRNRIGYGKGFYDKYLARYPGLQPRTIAVGFRCQIVEHISADEKDIKPSQVIAI